MTTDFIVFGLLPILLYVFVELKWGMRAGVVAAIVAAIFLIFWLYLKTNQIDYFLAADAVLIIFLGMLSVWLKNPRYFRFQPAILSGVLAVYALYFQFFSEPLFVHYIPIMRAMSVQPHVLTLLDRPDFVVLMGSVSAQFILLLLAHTVVCVVAALRFKSVAWLMTKVAILPAALVLFSMNLIIYGRTIQG